MSSIFAHHASTLLPFPPPYIFVHYYSILCLLTGVIRHWKYDPFPLNAMSVSSFEAQKVHLQSTSDVTSYTVRFMKPYRNLTFTNALDLGKGL